MLPAFFAYMDFRTLVNIKPFAKKMTYDSKAVSLGSCFPLRWAIVCLTANTMCC